MIISYDPGLTTGYAVFLEPPMTIRNDPSPKKAMLTSWGEFPLWEKIPNQITLSTLTDIVCEDLKIGSKTFHPEGFKVQGVLEYLAEGREIPIVYQSSMHLTSVRKFSPITAKISDHMKDAIHHGILFFIQVRKYKMSEIDLYSLGGVK